MKPPIDTERCRRVLVVIPNWVGDVVDATPMLSALRAHFSRARITYLLRAYVTEIVEGGGWHDEIVTWPIGGGLQRELRHGHLARRLRQERFDLACGGIQQLEKFLFF